MTPESTKRFLAWLAQETESAKTEADSQYSHYPGSWKAGWSAGYQEALLAVGEYFFGPGDTTREDAMKLCKNEVPTPEEYLDALAETLYKGMP